MYIMGMIVGLFLYYVIVYRFWRIILYVGFGGVQNDMINIPVPVKQAKGAKNEKYIVQNAPIQPQQQDGSGRWILILIILIIYIASYSVTPKYSIPSIPGIKKSQCIPTNCGNLRRSYCTNQCYTTQSQCMAAGRNICSNNMCRQCP